MFTHKALDSPSKRIIKLISRIWFRLVAQNGEQQDKTKCIGLTTTNCSMQHCNHL